MPKPTVFISYARADVPVAREIADRLSFEGFEVFYDQDLVAGDYSKRIFHAIRTASAVVVLLSSNSRQSKWVGEEIQAALDSKALVMSVLLDKGAKDNWLWPLLATKPSVELGLTSSNILKQLDDVVRRLQEELKLRVPAAEAVPLRERIAGVIVWMAFGAFLGWLLQRIF